MSFLKKKRAKRQTELKRQKEIENLTKILIDELRSVD